MSTENWFATKLEEFKDDKEFLTEQAILHFTEQVAAAMQGLRMTRAGLARKLGVSKAFVTKLLNGNPNLTIRTMVSLAEALGCRIDLNLYPRELEVRTFYTRRNGTPREEEYTEVYNVTLGGDFHAVAA